MRKKYSLKRLLTENEMEQMQLDFMQDPQYQDDIEEDLAVGDGSFEAAIQKDAEMDANFVAAEDVVTQLELPFMEDFNDEDMDEDMMDSEDLI